MTKGRLSSLPFEERQQRVKRKTCTTGDSGWKNIQNKEFKSRSAFKRLNNNKHIQLHKTRGGWGRAVGLSVERCYKLF